LATGLDADRHSKLLIPSETNSSKFALNNSQGTIANIGSIAGRNVQGDHTVYCGANFAMHAITESLRK
jgi:short-subunit dehydrogenase